MLADNCNEVDGDCLNCYLFDECEERALDSLADYDPQIDAEATNEAF